MKKWIQIWKSPYGSAEGLLVGTIDVALVSENMAVAAEYMLRYRLFRFPT